MTENDFCENTQNKEAKPSEFFSTEFHFLLYFFSYDFIIVFKYYYLLYNRCFIYMKKNQGLDFASKPKQKKATGTIALIVIGVLILGALSFVVILAKNDFDIDKFIGKRDDESTTADENTTSTEDVSESAPAFSDTEAVNFLFLCKDDTDLSFCSIISVSVKENNVKVKGIPTDYSFDTADGRQTLSELYRLKGVSAVREQFANKGIAIDRYVLASESAFKQILGKLGTTVVNVPRDTEFVDGEIKYTFSAGENEMTADNILKYIKFADTGDSSATTQAAAEAAVIEQHMTYTNFAKGDTFFSTLINQVETDISAFDYTGKNEEIKAFLLAEPSVTPIG